MSQRHDTGSGSSIPPSTATPPRVVNNHIPSEELQTPVLLRSETEQLVGQELIKALSNFKQSMVAPLSPHSRHDTSSEKETVVVHPEGKSKTKSRKPVFKIKVVRDMLTKKWIVVKRDKQLSVLSEVTRLLEALRLPP